MHRVAWRDNTRSINFGILYLYTLLYQTPYMCDALLHYSIRVKHYPQLVPAYSDYLIFLFNRLNFPPVSLWLSGKVLTGIFLVIHCTLIPGFILCFIHCLILDGIHYSIFFPDRLRKQYVMYLDFSLAFSACNL